MLPYEPYAAFKDGDFLVIIERDVLNPTRHRLRLAKFITFDERTDLDYWAAPSLARVMQGAADFYAAEMEQAGKDMDRLDGQ